MQMPPKISPPASDSTMHPTRLAIAFIAAIKRALHYTQSLMNKHNNATTAAAIPNHGD